MRTGSNISPCILNNMSTYSELGKTTYISLTPNEYPISKRTRNRLIEFGLGIMGNPGFPSFEQISVYASSSFSLSFLYKKGMKTKKNHSFSLHLNQVSIYPYIHITHFTLFQLCCIIHGLDFQVSRDILFIYY